MSRLFLKESVTCLVPDQSVGNRILWTDFDHITVEAHVWRYGRDGEVGEPSVRLQYWFRDEDEWKNGYGTWSRPFDVQVTPDLCRQAIDLIDRFEHVEFLPPEEELGFRDVELDFGVLQLRKYPDGTVRMWCGEVGGENRWLRTTVDDLRRFFRDVIARVEHLEDIPPAVEWH